jgi:hypothetical protein
MSRPDEAPVSGAPRVRLAPGPLPSPHAHGPGLERELKFTVPEERVALVRQRLTALCRPDPIHPPARVVTVYYDTPEYGALDEKANSDYLKTKIRVRWYEPLSGDPPGGAVFVEGKYRTGAIRSKVRVRVGPDAAEVRRWPLEDLRWTRLIDPLREEGLDVAPGMAPVLRLSYVRERFTDRVYGGRLTLDTAIAVEAVNTRRLPPHRGGRPSGAVLEHKGAATELPPHLRSLVQAGARKASFSKYLACYIHATGAVL